MASDLTKLTEAVTRIEDIGDALVTSYKMLAQQIKDNANNPAELNALASRLEAQATELKDAVMVGDGTPPADPPVDGQPTTFARTNASRRP